MTGKLIVIEGIDGIGKATTVHQLSQQCRGKNINHSVMTFPSYGTNTYAHMIDQYLKNKLLDPGKSEPMFLAMLYACDRYHNRTKLMQNLQTKDLVLLDRYVASNIAYQAARYHTPERQEQCKRQIYHIEHHIMELPKPDLYILINGNIKTAEENLKNENKNLDRHETNLPYLQRVKIQYQAIARADTQSQWHIVDISHCDRAGEETLRYITDQIWKHMDTIMA